MSIKCNILPQIIIVHVFRIDVQFDGKWAKWSLVYEIVKLFKRNEANI